MKVRRSDEEDRRIGREAAAWLVKQDRGLRPAEQDEFLQWLAQDPRHRSWLQHANATWGRFDRIPDWRPEHGSKPNPDVLAPGVDAPGIATRLRRWGYVAVAAGLVVATVWSAWGPLAKAFRPGQESRLLFTRGGQLRELLADGSVVEMNKLTRIKVLYSGEQRRVIMEGGQASFSVVKDPARPFVVRAGGIDVRAVGTIFDVKIDDAHIEVLVTEGSVSVEDSVKGETLMAGSDNGTAGLLLSGQMVRVARMPERRVTPESVSAAELRQRLAWRAPLFEFDSVPLRAVVERFNQRNQIQLIVADESLKDVTIVATFRAENVEGFVRLLEETCDVVAERRDTRIFLRRR